MRPTASLLPFGQWVCDKSREILKHRRCFHSVVIRYGRWGFAESRVLLINHPEWFLCCSVRSVGEFSHVLFQAHWALSCLPQISQICTDEWGFVKSFFEHESHSKRILLFQTPTVFPFSRHYLPTVSGATPSLVFLKISFRMASVALRSVV